MRTRTKYFDMKNPMGLSYNDPWAEIDAIIAEHIAAYAAVFDVFVNGEGGN